ncbi:MAG: riboflavin biosynthesis protein RibF [Phycisphaerales bacterium]|nr:riboflavin biosynthesis protein RibF [Phycisphaerales bacterium]
MNQPTALTIGNFDGVHIGHQAIIAHARQAVGPGGRVVAAVFSPHPMVHLNPERAPIEIEPISARINRLTIAGVDEVVVLDPSPGLLAMSPSGFVDLMIDQHQPTVIVEGADFRFGARRTGGVVELKELCAIQGVGVEVVAPLRTSISDQSDLVVSSTMIRWMLAHGRVRDAGFLLGRMHEIRGVVVRGDQLGRTIGFPTANLRTETMLPCDGVYAGVAVLPTGEECIAAINVGTRPTVQGLNRRAEAHLLNADSSVWVPPRGSDEYGWDCTIRLMAWVRDEIKFGSIDTLKEQLGRDVGKICTIVQRFLPATADATATN